MIILFVAHCLLAITLIVVIHIVAILFHCDAITIPCRLHLLICLRGRYDYCRQRRHYLPPRHHDIRHTMSMAIQMTYCLRPARAGDIGYWLLLLRERRHAAVWRERERESYY